MVENPEIKMPYPEGETRFYGGIHPVKILPEIEHVNCKMKYNKYKSAGEQKIRSQCYPCEVLEDFVTGKGLTFSKGEKVVLRKQYLHRTSKKKKG
jgi:hypothetical protein